MPDWRAFQWATWILIWMDHWFVVFWTLDRVFTYKRFCVRKFRIKLVEYCCPSRFMDFVLSIFKLRDGFHRPILLKNHWINAKRWNRTEKSFLKSLNYSNQGSLRINSSKTDASPTFKRVFLKIRRVTAA